MSTRLINFTLNGQPVSTAIEPHRNLVELLQRFDLFGAREAAAKDCAAVARRWSTARRCPAVCISRFG